ncbi:hypothetical protein Bca52824_022545 [Brassica carinata]|uniref:Uncharacterized protein n=1 Tax=Brassica carinata TaxID=52824 RepID=A0A8X8ATG7_BRACI|nr:hypothetical protein Bca52824_022545 [Brassica carinata]
MFTCLFPKRKQKETKTLQTLEKLNETLGMLEKKESLLLKRAAEEVERAKEFTCAKNKRAAMMCLKRKRVYEQQVEQLGNYQFRIHDQLTQGAKATTETVDALRIGASTMKAMQKATNFEDVDKTMNEINDQTDNMRHIQDSLSAPFGFDFNEDELEADLEELESAELEEELPKPVRHVQNLPARPATQKKQTAYEDELVFLHSFHRRSTNLISMIKTYDQNNDQNRIMLQLVNNSSKNMMTSYIREMRFLVVVLPQLFGQRKSKQ